MQHKTAQEHSKAQLYKVYGVAIANKRYRDAITKYERYRRQNALTSNEQYRLATLYDHLAMMNEKKLTRRLVDGYLWKAQALYREILKKDPSYFHALHGIGRIYNIRKRYKIGLRFQMRAYQQMLKLPRRRRGALAIGSTYETIGDYKTAEQWYWREYHDAPRNDFGAICNLFMFYKRRGDWEKALQLVARVQWLMKLEYKKKIYSGKRMAQSRFVRQIKRQVREVREKSLQQTRSSLRFIK